MQGPFTKGSCSQCSVSGFTDVSLSFKGLADDVHGRALQLVPNQLTPTATRAVLRHAPALWRADERAMARFSAVASES